MDTEHDLFAQFARIGELLHRHQHWTRRAHGPVGDPHRGQGRVMALLKMQPEITQKDLSFLLDIRPQSLGELLAKLERGGYIERTPSDSDRRGMNIRLTEAGTQAAEQSATPTDMFTSLSREEQATLSRMLERIIAELEQSLEAMRGDGPPARPAPRERRHFHRHDHDCERERHGHHHHPPHDCDFVGREHPRGELPRHPGEHRHGCHPHEGRQGPHWHCSDGGPRRGGDRHPPAERPETLDE